MWKVVLLLAVLGLALFSTLSDGQQGETIQKQATRRELTMNRLKWRLFGSDNYRTFQETVFKKIYVVGLVISSNSIDRVLPLTET